MNKENKVIKISDVVENQIPEFVLSDNQNFPEFLKQYYISQEFQGGAVDLAENLIDYRNIETFDTTNLIASTKLSQEVEYFDDQIFVESTKGWPEKYGLLRIDDEIITYTGITTNSFTGCVRGFSGIKSFTQDNNPEFLEFSQTNASEHVNESIVYNLSNLFIQEFFRKIKYQFTPGFENTSFHENINPANFISKAKDFYQTKGTDEAFKILFKVLYNEDVKVIKPYDYTFVTSDDGWVVCASFICDPIDGDATLLSGQTLYQDQSSDESILPANGSIYSVDTFYSNRKKYYRINLFAGYSNNLNPKGSISGTFVETPRTYVVEETLISSTTITVNSTLGFKKSGKLSINGTEVTYTDKTNNQFLNCSGLTSNLSPKTMVYGDNFVYSYEDGDIDKKVTLRILSTLSGIKETNAKYALNGDKIQVDNFGDLDDSQFTKSLLYNHPLTVFSGKLKSTLESYDVEGISLLNGSVRTKFNHKLKTNDVVDLWLTDFDQKIKSNVVVNASSGVENQYSINVSGISSYINKNITSKRKIFKSSSSNYPEINNKFAANVQDSYSDSEYNYITSNGLPSFSINPYFKKFDFDLSTSDYETLNGPHSFETGELVTVDTFALSGTYKNEVGVNTGTSFYVKKVDSNNIKLAYSKPNVGLSSFINFSELVNPPIDTSVAGFVQSFTLVESNLFGNTFGSSKLFKKIPKTPQTSTNLVETSPGSLGVFCNGLEIQNYKTYDKVYYGKIESINILNSGDGYDLLNPPQFTIDNGQDTYTRLIPEMTGKLETLAIVNPGFDYTDTPVITVTGGRTNEYIRTEVKMKLESKVLDFNAASTAGYVSDSEDSFRFPTNHGLSTGDALIYSSFQNTPIGIGTLISDGSLVNNEVYYAINVGAGTSFKLAKTQIDAENGTYIPIREFGSGSQRFTSVNKKQVIDRINVFDEGFEFKYIKIFLNSNQVNHFDDIFIFDNHGFISNDEVKYSYEGTILSGLSTTTNYYIHKVDENRFKLKLTKESTTFVNFNSSDSSTTHYFEHTPIQVNVIGNLGVDNNNQVVGIPAVIKPVINSKITNVRVEKSLDNYGDASVLNYKKTPNIEEKIGSGCNLSPVVFEGKIVNVFVKNSGEDYFNSIELKVKGSGYGAKLEPTIVNGSITSVSIVYPGVGYDNSTTIEIVPKGKGLKLSSNIQSWRLNKVDLITPSNLSDGMILGKNYSIVGNILGVFFPIKKILDQFGVENLIGQVNPQNHSPIIGWAYDGCPIYGPDGYANSDGSGGLKRLRSSYRLSKKTFTEFPLVDDYEYIDGLGDLDENNGRFCVTPEYPNGVYAYFCTVSNSRDPIFPYVIGKYFKYNPNKDNFNLRINQNVDLNSLEIFKHTLPYGVENKNNYYEYIDFIQSSPKSDILITNTSEGNIDEVFVVNGGENYKIGDNISFDNTGSFGYGASGIVSELDGVGVSSVSSSSSITSNVTFTLENSVVVGIASTSHNLKDGSYISISNISDPIYSKLNGYKKVSVPQVETKLLQNVSNEATTGITTFIRVQNSIFEYEVDTLIKIGSETLKVIGIDYYNNLLKVLRESGASSHSIADAVTVLPNKIYLEDFKIDFLPDKNISYYFNPEQSVSVGLSTSVGAGNTLTISSEGLGLDQTKFIPTGRIFIPNHRFNNGDEVIYTYGSTPITVYDYDGTTSLGNLDSLSNLFVVKIDDDIIGLTSQRNKTNTTDGLLLYSSVEDNELHKFKTIRSSLTGDVLYNQTTINTTSDHGLSVNDVVKVNVKSGITTSYTVTHDDPTAKLKIDSLNNPRIDVYSNDTVIFNISSITSDGSKFKLYTDKDFIHEYFGSFVSGEEEVEVSSSSLTLKIRDNTPKTLYYNIESSTKTTYTDDSIEGFNTIRVLNSVYNQKDLVVTGITSTSFIVNYPQKPERDLYTSENSTISYNVLSSNVLSSISKVKLLSKGSEYKKLPKINLVSENGSGANLIPLSSNIGKILSHKVINNDFIIPSDKTLVPISNLYSTVFLKDNYTVDNLEIITRGSNYLNSPDVILYSNKTGSIISDFSAFVSMKDGCLEDIQIINPSSGLLSTDDNLVFINNTNGIKILGGSYNSTTKTVTLTLETPPSGFSESNPFPFAINDKVFIEGVGSIGSGYNSSDYDYQFFTVTDVFTAYGSEDASQIMFYLPQNPGLFVEIDSLNAYVINSKNIPTVKVNLKENIFYSGESINNTSIINNVNNDPISNILKIKSAESLSIDDEITGLVSNSKGTICKIENYSSTLDRDTSSMKTIGWKKSQGNLSDIIQKLPDNDYYQRFSYSLKSKKSFTDWNSIVSDVAHISGFKKFSDLIVESESTDSISSITSDQSSLVNISLSSYVDINTVNDIDLATENVDFYGGKYSDIITFENEILADYLLSRENRVLCLDDISDLFDTDVIPQVNILTDKVTDTKLTLKYIFFIQTSESFIGDFVDPLFFECLLSRSNDTLYLTSYSFYEPNEIGKLKAEVSTENNEDIDVYFTPVNPFNSLLIRALREQVNIEVGISTSYYGHVKTISLTQECAPEISPTQKTLYSIPISESVSGTFMVGVSSIYKNIEKVFESSYVYNNGIVQSNAYAENEFSSIGSVGVSTSGSNIIITYDGVPGIGVTVYGVFNFITGISSSTSTIIDETIRLNSSRVTYSGTSQTGISTVNSNYGASKYVIEVKKYDPVGLTTEVSLISLDSVHYNMEDHMYNINYGILGNIEDLEFEVNYDSINDEYLFSHIPSESADYTITFFEKNILKTNT